MRIAFYAPLKSPGHPVPSGDRRVARLLIGALEAAGHSVEVASQLRSFDRDGDARVQRQVERDAAAETRRLVEDYRARPPAFRPDAWFTYHVYYKAPDWLGPAVSYSLGIAYATAEASIADKRRNGPWAANHEQTRKALLAGDVHFCMTGFDRVALTDLLGGEERLVALPPFLETVPQPCAGRRAERRSALCAMAGFDPSVPVIMAVAMMRAGDKQRSYAMLAEALGGLTERAWNLVLVGDGAARPAVEASFSRLPRQRLLWMGEVAPEAVGDWLAVADLYAWPSCNEAYGMALLEAQARGVPVVAQATRGVPDVVADGRTGLLTPEGDTAAFRQALVALLEDGERRSAMGEAARAFVAGERSVASAAAILDDGLRAAMARR